LGGYFRNRYKIRGMFKFKYRLINTNIMYFLVNEVWAVEQFINNLLKKNQFFLAGDYLTLI